MIMIPSDGDRTPIPTEAAGAPPTHAEELDRVAAVDHDNPHAILGVHEVGGGLVVRAYRPDALSITVLPDDTSLGPRVMDRIHPLGIFEAVIPGARRPFHYRIEVRYAKDVFVLRDPYAFPPSLGELDLHLLAEGTHQDLYRRLGAHVRAMDGVSGTAFAVWAPNARRVSVAGDFNAWDGRLHAMRRLEGGIWEIFLPDIGEGAVYKYEIKTPSGLPALKSDPYANAAELRPATASKVAVRRYEFTDQAWIAERAAARPTRRPISIYEVHLASWRRVPATEEGQAGASGTTTRWMTYRELADALLDYVVDLGFTHIELLPIMEHPLDASWGYQVTGYFAPTSRHGSPDDLRYFIDRCHARGVGVLLDWVPAHFPKDAFALGRFDGTAVYEHLDPRKGEHRHWDTYIFNYGRNQVKNFLIASALYWFDEFHIDGIRVDAVASMLHLDFSASGPDDWVPNEHGGRENLEAIVFLRELNDRVHTKFPGVIVAAEESTTWPGVTRPTYTGGLGFDFKWNMGWMHDTLDYFAQDPIYRAFHHHLLTFGLMYAFSEEFLLPLSHDEVVHLKKSLISKMAGNDRWKMHANLRALFGYMWAHPGKKLLFMGGEIGQWGEWNFESQLDWDLLEQPDHAGVQRLVRDLNAAYRRYPALHELDDDPEGFTWIDANDSIQSVASFVRFPRQSGQAVANSEREGRGRAVPPPPSSGPGVKSPRSPVQSDPDLTVVSMAGPAAAGAPEPAAPALPIPPPARRPKRGSHVVFVGNFTPVPRIGYRIGVPRRCAYREVLNTDAAIYGGSGMGNMGRIEVQSVLSHDFAQSLVLTLPPLSVLWLVPELDDDPM